MKTLRECQIKYKRNDQKGFLAPECLITPLYTKVCKALEKISQQMVADWFATRKKLEAPRLFG